MLFSWLELENESTKEFWVVDCFTVFLKNIVTFCKDSWNAIITFYLYAVFKEPQQLRFVIHQTDLLYSVFLTRIWYTIWAGSVLQRDKLRPICFPTFSLKKKNTEVVEISRWASYPGSFFRNHLYPQELAETETDPRASQSDLDAWGSLCISSCETS